MKTSALVNYLDTYLEAKGCPDYCPNGLQVAGRPEVKRVVCGVTACLELIEAAAERGADALLVHHGILWGNSMPTLTGSFRRRVKALLDADLNLIAYHLPLDRHLEVGNGAAVAQRLGLTDVETFGLHKGVTVGVRGNTAAGDIDSLAAQISDALDTTPTVLPYGPSVIRSVGVVTGAADKDLPQAVEAGLDCYITGEISEFVMHFAKEEGIHFIAAGHHATERYGVQQLGAHLATTHGLEWEFVDVPNPA
ncbi:MAG: dinuclear metal center YbgI/SA1388 family protein [Myxococcota bacterium]|jgi:dinuclear metal center YbgI/SA1388 family protein